MLAGEAGRTRWGAGGPPCPGAAAGAGWAGLWSPESPLRPAPCRESPAHITAAASWELRLRPCLREGGAQASPALLPPPAGGPHLWLGWGEAEATLRPLLPPLLWPPSGDVSSPVRARLLGVRPGASQPRGYSSGCPWLTAGHLWSLRPQLPLQNQGLQERRGHSAQALCGVPRVGPEAPSVTWSQACSLCSWLRSGTCTLNCCH